MADDGHTINVGPVTIGEPLARAPVADPIDTDAVRERLTNWRGALTPPEVLDLCDEVDRLRAERDEARAERDVALNELEEADRG